jgi:Flp pilus assembly pilin Flp
MNKGQALIEYILLFGMISLVSMGLVRAISGFMSNSTGSLSYALTQQLTTGSCERFCFFGYYGNGDE